LSSSLGSSAASSYRTAQTAAIRIPVSGAVNKRTPTRSGGVWVPLMRGGSRVPAGGLRMAETLSAVCRINPQAPCESRPSPADRADVDIQAPRVPRLE
jgi:hypothetical protein